MQKIVLLLRAMQLGNELKDPAKWKKDQVTTNLAAAIVALLVSAINIFLPDVPLPEIVVEYLTEITVFILAIINIYWTLATSKKVGV